jgi:hypothetical protein
LIFFWILLKLWRPFLNPDNPDDLFDILRTLDKLILEGARAGQSDGISANVEEGYGMEEL